MQTFLPYPDFRKSAAVLDYRRLGKQRVETLQIVITLLNGRAAWANHPATKMWRGYEAALISYGMDICDGWIRRGYKDTCEGKLRALAAEAGLQYDAPTMPPWLGDAAFHASHRSALLRKDPDWYGRYGWSEGPGLEYVWPVE